MLPGPRPRPELKPNRTRGLVRRATPFFAIAAVIAVQAGLALSPVLVFPLYLLVVLLTAVYSSRLDSLTVAVFAAIGLAAPSVVAGGGSNDLAVPLLLAAVLVVVAITIHEVVGRIRAEATGAERKAAELQAREERLRITVDAAQVGLALVGANGGWLLVNERLCVILGRSRAELLHLTVADVTSEHDQSAIAEALSMLRTGDILRWEAELHQVRGDGSRVPVEITMAAVSDHPGGERVLLVQETDVSARKRVDGLRDGLVAVRHTIVSATTWEQAAP